MKKGALLGILLVLLMPGAAHADREMLFTVGDSITRGDGLPDRMSERYPARLRNHGPRIRVVAHGGQCLVATTCAYRPRLVDTFKDEVLSRHPDEVVVHIGVNDLAHATDQQMRHAYRKLRQEGKAAGVKVYIATITPTAVALTLYPRDWVEPQRQRINRWIRRTWPQSHIDLAAALEDESGAMRPRYASPDGLHPNALGTEAMAEALRAKLMPYRTAIHE
jgi:lysophospholipase L1-like esterase